MAALSRGREPLCEEREELLGNTALSLIAEAKPSTKTAKQQLDGHRVLDPDYSNKASRIVPVFATFREWQNADARLISKP